ncbi:adenosylcobinamide-GDP ribazoletransferase [Sulfuracidifex tepidarius]|uniref:Adenosylcobinamide-GDP ribazoletransferase n=1 Tax=Sulfuracidifex tepidarius TaxID=1294262 RepID=A0A510E666_9CREN|nr:adenosylcobinamide-GDP ribazoletransferase [Sulfuracidifex tepidarius]BBG24731.1 Adenosylcobinamide-GDP ribazoletransferase [Sulfuracidifex tepidarius]BBG27520.1 Adenosylcobinamide-GDP ribazoletransferase [Sulfuracidifex tepidarius]
MQKIKAVIAQYAFFSIIPVRVNVQLEEVASVSFIAPLLVGLTAGLTDFGFLLLTRSLLGEASSFLLLAFVELFRGFHHLDGLLDTGDALMAIGKEKKMRALKDVQVGAGGIGATLVYISLFLTAVSNLRSPLSSLVPLVSAEVLSRGVGMLSLVLSTPLEGSFLGLTFSKYLRRYYPLLILTMIPFLSFYTLLILIFMIAVSLGIERNLGGSSGDVVGAVITLSFPIFLLGDLKCSTSLFSLLLSTL